MFVSRSAVNINVLDGRRGDCATRHSAALRAVALARARCTLSPLCLFVRQPALHYAAHLYHHEQPHFSVPVYRRLRVLRHRHLHSPLLAGRTMLRHSLLFHCVGTLLVRPLATYCCRFERKSFSLFHILPIFLFFLFYFSHFVRKIKVNNRSCISSILLRIYFTTRILLFTFVIPYLDAIAYMILFQIIIFQLHYHIS